MARTARDTTNWVAEQLRSKSGIQTVEVQSPCSLLLTRQKGPSFVAGILSEKAVRPEHVELALGGDASIEILVNVPKGGYWTGPAIAAASKHQIAFGSMKDLLSVIGREIPVREYERPEFEFVQRGLRQHSRVSQLDREADRLFLVHRIGLKPIRFVMLYEYELTGEHVRDARDRYGEFNLILINNPNGQPTGAATAVAESLNIEIHLWGEFLARLNKP